MFQSHSGFVQPRIWVIACLLGSCSMAVYAQPQEKILQKQKLTVSQQAQFCQQWAQFCEQDQASLFQVKNNPKQLYAIQALKLGEFRQDGQHFTLINQWDFSGYRPRTQVARWAMSDRAEDKQLSIFPKLFPINAEAYAVGIVQAWQEGYSGGGMSEEVVDFVELKPNGQYQQIFQNIPLSMDRLIRACFSEDDYLSSGEKCHDEYQLTTQIMYVKPYTWQVKYHYQADYSPASDSGTKPVSLHKTYLLKENRADAIVLPKAWE